MKKINLIGIIIEINKAELIAYNTMENGSF
jgi:hypothetical protein